MVMKRGGGGGWGEKRGGINIFFKFGEILPNKKK